MDRTLEQVLAGGYELEIDERFDGVDLNRSRWFPHHLPQWSSRARSAARYELVDGTLHLRIDADQQPWCPEFDGATRVSSLQTGVFSGPVGSTIGQHRFIPDAVVREAQDNARLLTPTFGVVVLRARGVLDPACMVALWMIGYEDRPERSAEICVVEIFGRDATADRAAVGMGVHPFGDPTIRDDFEAVPLPIDVRDLHEYAAQWTPRHVTFFVDGVPVRRVEQSPRYAMQFMLGIYEFDEPTTRDSYPKRFVIDRFQVYRPREV